MYRTPRYLPFPSSVKRTVIGGVSFDPNLFEANLFSNSCEEVTSQKFSEDQEERGGPTFRELTPKESEHEDSARDGGFSG